MSGKAQINISARVNEIVDKQQEYIEMMCMAYLKLTSIPPEEVVLVQDWRHDKIRWYFERKKGVSGNMYWDQATDVLVVVDRDGYKVVKKDSGEIVVVSFSQDTSSERAPTELERYLIEELIERYHEGLERSEW